MSYSVKRPRCKQFFRVMRITTLLLFVFIFCMHAENSSSQNVNVTIKRSNTELENVLNDIEKQTDYLFIYNKFVNVDRKVSVNLKKASLEEVLANLFAGTDVKYSVDGSYILLSAGGTTTTISLSAQQGKMVSGVITDINGEPIIGANVIEKDSESVGTVTDVDGKFTLALDKPAATLVVSYIGYLTKEVPVGSQSVLKIILSEDTQNLEEVVVIGYGSVKKSDLTGAVGSIQVDKVQGISVKSVDQMLQGRTSGLYMVQNSGMPGASSTVRIRGGNSISGGNDKTTFLTSFNYFNQEGVIKASEMKKYAFRANIDHKISSTINLGLSLTMTKVDNNRVGNSVLQSRLTTPSNLPVMQDDGSYTFSDNNGVITFDNPVGVINEKVDWHTNFRSLNNAFVEWNIIKGLKFKSSFGIDIDYATNKSYNPRSVYSGSQKNGEAKKISNNTYTWINENILTYTNTWGVHSFTGMVGYTQQQSAYDGFNAGSYGFLNDNLQMNNLGSGTTYTAPGSEVKKWALNSYLARVNYTVNNKYLLTASIRADGSSRFGSDNRWGYFPSAALAWRASEESFIKDLNIFSNLKPRVSFGITGNQDGIGTYPAYALLGSNGYVAGGDKVTGYYPSQVANTNLKWETTAQFDAGIDFGFFNNRLTVVIDGYYKKTRDLLLKVKVPGSSGFSSGLKNIGEVENKGFELAINATPIEGDFTWNTSLNLTYNKNKVLDLGDVSFIYPSQPGQDETGIHLGRIIQVGQPLGTFYGYVYDGLFSTTDDIASSAQPTAKPGDIRYKDISGPDGVPDGVINDLDRTIIGCAQPKLFGGFNNTFSYKNFDLNVNTIFTIGNDVYNGTRVTMENMQGSTNMFASTMNYWTPDNQNAPLPRPLRSKAVMRVSNQYVENGSYLRFQNITLGYNVPTEFLSFTKYVSGLRVYASLQNFITITSYSGDNPEVSKYGQDNLGAGYDAFSYPFAKSVLFGLNVKF